MFLLLVSGVPADCLPGGPWDNHAFEACLAARESFPVQYGLFERTFARPAEELYDLHTDPGEIYNLAEDPRFAGPLGRLRGRLGRWMTQTQDPGVKLINRPRRTKSA